MRKKILKQALSLANLKCQYKYYSSKPVLLETIRIKYDQVIRDAHGYLKRLGEEKTKLMEVLIAGGDVTAHKGNESFQRLDYLKRVEAVWSELQRIELDLAELLASTASEQDGEMKKLIEDDIIRLGYQLVEKRCALVDLMLPVENEDNESAILELSAGVGGLESRIFCGELFEMYRIYAEKQNWQFSIRKVYTDMTDMGEIMRQAHVEVEGRGVFALMKFESGVHRVQRVPKTESKGRIHTSTVGVVVVPKPEEINIELNPNDLKIETKTSGGPGGQHANKTESAVRIVHLPTGITIYRDDERYMQVNRTRALNELKERLYQRQYEEQLNKRQMNRKMQIGSSGRSERIRTYNFIQDRITDHRLGENFTGIQRFLSAETLPNVIENLRASHKLELLEELLEQQKRNS